MLAFRVIARLDVKGENVVKGIQMEGLRVVGKPNELSRRYADEGADEIIFNAVASLYGRTNLEKILEEATRGVFVPITVGGGIRSIQDARSLFNAGADKVMVNTAALARPELIDEMAAHFGGQAIVAGVEAKRVNGGWHAFSNAGRDDSGRDAVAWMAECVERGAGEILLTSIDRDGTNKGPDLDLARRIKVSVPLILSGGITSETVQEAASASDAVAVGCALHQGRASLQGLKSALSGAGVTIRPIS